MTNNFDLIRPYLTYTNIGDFYFLQILKRRKENPGMEKGSKVINVFYIYSVDTFNKIEERVIELCEKNNARAYIRMNVRNDKKIAFQFLKRVTDLIVSEQYRAINAAYDSVCGEFHSDEDKTWVVDVDTKDEGYLSRIRDVINTLHKEILKPGKSYKIKFELPTKNGYHIITNPFNLSLFKARLMGIENEVNGITNKMPLNVLTGSKCEIHKDNPTILYCP